VRAPSAKKRVVARRQAVGGGAKVGVLITRISKVERCELMRWLAPNRAAFIFRQSQKG